MPSATERITIPARLLVVDDDLLVRQVGRAVLEQAGCTVFECADGVAGLELFQRERPDIVLLDVMMPGMNGFELCSAIRALPEGGDVPIVMMTALDDSDSLLTAFRVGGTDFITKPISWQTLPYRMQYIFKTGQAFRDLRTSEKKLHHAQQIARIGSWGCTLNQPGLLLSDSCRELLGLTRGAQLDGVTALVGLVHPSEQERVREALEGLVEQGHPVDLDCRWSDLNGRHRYFHMGGEPRRDPFGQVTSLTGTIQDITERRLSEEKIRYLAYYDSLTGLPNRTLFKEHLKRTLGVAQQHHQRVAVLFLDLDRFKGVNDTMGHDAGDTLLRLVAERIQRHLRSYDTLSRSTSALESPVLSRLGGDEFTVLLEGIQAPETAALVARRIISTLELPFQVNQEEVFISASIGISTYPEDGTDADSLVKHADIAMYSAKELGQGSYQYYRKEMNDASIRRLSIERNLRRALEEESLGVLYQPQIDCQSGDVVGLEALVRWTSPELGVVSPEAFVPVAEESGLIIPLDRWVLETVCRQLAAWQEEGICPELVSVNLSARHFQKKYLGETLSLILKLPEPIRQRLGIEITERTLLDNTDEVMEALALIAGRGVHISLDDFGTGYSSLSYLACIPCQVLKIDKSFISRINQDPNSMTIIDAIIALARSLNKEVVAEGVETAEQLEFLRRHGCSVIQGYLFHRPLALEPLRELLKGERARASAPDAPCFSST